MGVSPHVGRRMAPVRGQYACELIQIVGVGRRGTGVDDERLQGELGGLLRVGDGGVVEGMRLIVPSTRQIALCLEPVVGSVRVH